MKISLAQTKIIWEAKEKNLSRAEKIIRNQSNQGVEFILFPEMSFTGFSMHTDVTKETGYTMERIKTFCKEYNIAIGFGWVKDCGNKCENHYSILDSFGNVIIDYAKIHPFSYGNEDSFFNGGNSIVIGKLNEIRYSVFICYDLRFPEIFQSVADEVSVIIIPANWPSKRSGQWNALLKARAIENQVYILAINCVGEMNGQYYLGDSCMISPEGTVIKRSTGIEDILTIEVKDDVSSFRDQFPVRKDRRPDLYKQLYGYLRK